MILHLIRGEIMDQRRLLRRLADMQYTRNELDLQAGTYRVRGDVIDIFPAESAREAIRVELFDETVESLALFDPLTGEIQRKVPRYTVYPGSHYVTPKERVIGAIDAIRDELRDRLKVLREQNKLVEAQRLEQRTLFDMEMMREVGYCSGIENYSRYLSGRAPGEPPPCLFDYLPQNALLVIDESHQTIPQLGAMYKGDRSRKETLVEYGFRLPSALDNRPLKMEEWEQLAPQMIFVSATPGKYEAAHAAQTVEQVLRPTHLVDPVVEVRPVATQVDDVLSEIKLRAEKDERVLITTLTKRMAEDLTEYLHEHGVKVRYLHADVETVERSEIIRDLRLGKFDVIVGINLLREGLDMPEVSLVAILDADKEGFLRSDNSLIQTMGRAARHVNGKAILYADRMTGSMERAIDETDRRRNVQLAYNIEHGTTPISIRKNVTDVMEGARADTTDFGYKMGKKKRGAEEAAPNLRMLVARADRARDQAHGGGDVQAGAQSRVRRSRAVARCDREVEAAGAGARRSEPARGMTGVWRIGGSDLIIRPSGVGNERRQLRTAVSDVVRRRAAARPPTPGVVPLAGFHDHARTRAVPEPASARRPQLRDARTVPGLFQSRDALAAHRHGARAHGAEALGRTAAAHVGRGSA